MGLVWWMKYTSRKDRKEAQHVTDSKRLQDLIKSSGYKKAHIAEKLGLSTSGLYNCINNRAEFKASQILTLCEMLNIDAADKEAIFFAVNGG